MPTGPPPRKRLDAVFEGGGVKGIAFAGALSVAEEYGYRDFQNVAGTSAGAIVAALIAAGYTAGGLKEIMESLDYSKFQDQGAIDRIPVIGKLISLIFEKGLYEGDYFRDWLDELLQAKGVKTFGDIRTEFPEEQYRYKLRVIAADISGGRMLILPQDLAEEFGVDPDGFPVSDAVRMSMSIPYFYEPFRLDKRFIVDGGVLSNFPVWLFDSAGVPEWPTFGFKLVTREEMLSPRQKIYGPITLLKALFLTMMEAHDARQQEESNTVRTINIDTLDVKATDFHLSKDGAQALYASGERAARRFFESWDFERYVRQFRSRSPG